MSNLQRIGIDLDNTLVCYDAIFYQIAYQQGSIPRALAPQKQCVRDYIRRHTGDIAWQKLQAMVYTEGMKDAQLFPHALEILEAWRRQGHQLRIISHKTRFSPHAPGRDLRQAALHFLQAQGVLDLVPMDKIVFLSSRAEKIETLTCCDCTVFIDDLSEVLTDVRFPSAMKKILFDPHALYSGTPLSHCQSWRQIAAAVRMLSVI